MSSQNKKAPVPDASFMSRNMRFMMSLPASWNAQTRLTAMALFGHANEYGGGIYAGIARLMVMTGLSRSGLMRCLKFLTDNNFLITDGKHVHENGVATTLRRLNLSEILRAHEAEKSGSPTGGTSATGDGGMSHSWPVGSPTGGTQTESNNREITESPCQKPSASDADADQDFMNFWLSYPSYRRASKPATFRAWRKARKKFGQQAIMDGLARHKQFWPTSGKDARCRVVPMASTWLNKERFLDTEDAAAVNFLPDGQRGMSTTNAALMELHGRLVRGEVAEFDDSCMFPDGE